MKPPITGSFEELYRSESIQAFVREGTLLKERARKNERRQTITAGIAVLTSCVVGYFALGWLGAALFLMVTYTAAAMMIYMVKKNELLRYLSFYRTKLPRAIAEAAGWRLCETEEADFSRTGLADLFGDGIWRARVRHTYCFGEQTAEIAYKKRMENGRAVSEGLVIFYENAGSAMRGKRYLVKSEQAHDSLGSAAALTPLVRFYASDGVCPEPAEEKLARLLDGYFTEFAVCLSEHCAVYMPYESEYLAGRIEKKDDLSDSYLKRQYDYVRLAAALSEILLFGETAAEPLFGKEAEEN